MEKEKIILAKLGKQFPGLGGLGIVPAERRIFLDVPQDIFMDVAEFAAGKLGFSHLCTITGLDCRDTFEFIYHTANNEGIILNLKLKVPSDHLVISSVLPIYNGATFYERELEGILGVKVEGLPAGRQYPLPDNWPEGQYPLRKDWTSDMLLKN